MAKKKLARAVPLLQKVFAIGFWCFFLVLPICTVYLGNRALIESGRPEGLPFDAKKLIMRWTWNCALVSLVGYFILLIIHVRMVEARKRAEGVLPGL